MRKSAETGILKSRQYRTLFCLAVIALLGAAGGCRGGKPAGFPPLVPVEIGVERDGAPMEDVDLCLISDRQTVPWSVSGRTGSNGTAGLITSQGSYSKTGAPCGTFRVTLRKSIPPIEELPGNEVEALPPQEKAEYAAKIAADRAERDEMIGESTPAFLGNIKETPVTIEITKDTHNITIKIDDYL